MISDWSLPYSSRRTPVLARNVVATSQPLAAQAGLSMLERGGNAVDAALTTAIALTVLEPCSNGIGSDAFALVWDGHELHGLNGSGRSPATWSSSRFRGLEAISTGYDSVTVPGAVAAWVDLSRRFGRIPFFELFAPALHYARAGFSIGPTVHAIWSDAADSYRDFAEFRRVFLPHDRVPQIGELFAVPDHAATLERIAKTRGEAFYHGELAQQIAAHMGDHGAALDAADLASHSSDWVTPLTLDYHGYQVHEMPPNGQGIALLIALGVLRHLGLAAYPVDSVDSIHLQIEAMKLAFAVLQAHVADPEYMTMSVETLLDEQVLAAAAEKIDLARARPLQSPIPVDGGTVYLTCGDADGMMVSFIQSNFWGFGSGVVIPGTGISLHNRAAGFSLQAGHPNCVTGGKRPLHTIIPGFVTRSGKPLLSFGVMGAHMQAQGQLQLLTRLIDYGQNPQAAADAPRWFVDTHGAVAVENWAPDSWQEGLAARGHRPSTQVTPFTFGGAQLVMRLDNGLYCAASDPRKDGLALGFG